MIHCFIPSITEYEKHVCLICAFFLAGSLSTFPSLDLKILLVMYPYSHFCSVLSSLFRSEELSFCSPAESSLFPHQSPLFIFSVPTFLLLSIHKLDPLDLFSTFNFVFHFLSLYVMLCSGKVPQQYFSRYKIVRFLT